MEQEAPNATVRVCFASLEKTEKMEGQPLYVFVWKKVEKTEIWRTWAVALYSSLWEEMIEQKFWSQSSARIWWLEMFLAHPGEGYYIGRIPQPKPAPLNQVSTSNSSKYTK